MLKILGAILKNSLAPVTWRPGFVEPCISTIIIRHFKSRRMEWAGHVARMGEEFVQDFGGKA
jgi:hypothetical protein